MIRLAKFGFSCYVAFFAVLHYSTNEVIKITVTGQDAIYVKNSAGEDVEDPTFLILTETEQFENQTEYTAFKFEAQVQEINQKLQAGVVAYVEVSGIHIPGLVNRNIISIREIVNGEPIRTTPDFESTVSKKKNSVEEAIKKVKSLSKAERDSICRVTGYCPDMFEQMDSLKNAGYSTQEIWDMWK